MRGAAPYSPAGSPSDSTAIVVRSIDVDADNLRCKGVDSGSSLAATVHHSSNYEAEHSSFRMSLRTPSPTGEEACTAAWLSWWREEGPFAPPKRGILLDHVFYSDEDELVLRRMAALPRAPALRAAPCVTAMVREEDEDKDSRASK